MGNAISSPPLLSDASDTNRTSPPEASDELSSASFSSFEDCISSPDGNFSITESEREVPIKDDIYDDSEERKEETTLCSSPLFLMRRKSDPLTIPGSSNHGNSRYKRLLSIQSCMESNRNTENEDDGDNDDIDVNCGMPRSVSWASMDDYAFTPEEMDMIDGDLPTIESDLRPSDLHGCRDFYIVTTAALPWFTGTSINPLLRAAYFSQMNRPYAEMTDNGVPKSTVTLVVPWLESEQDRATLYGPDWKSKTMQDQDACIRHWLAETANMPLEADLSQGGIRIEFYPARWHKRLNSIFAMGDICDLLCRNHDKLDVCFLEEPEHLNWYKAASSGNSSWTDKFHHVVGIGHTNYVAYIQKSVAALATPAVSTYSSWMVRAYCHKLIKLSPVLQTYAPEKEVVCNVHGIRKDFLETTCTRQERSGIYFLGKLLWAKGLDELIELQGYYKKQTGDYFEIDIVGSGPEQEEIERAFQGRQELKSLNSSDSLAKMTVVLPKSRHEFRKSKIPARFLGRQDHLQACRHYKIFLNPSRTEVLCTATAEAIAMNKFVIVPVHPSNSWFEQFPNCLQYRTKKEFCDYLQYALTHEPEPLSPDLSYQLTWEAATERCLEASVITRRDAKRLDRVGKTKRDKNIAKLHNELGKGHKGNIFRAVIGAGPVADQYVPPTTPTDRTTTVTSLTSMALVAR
jgi:hypothetical protein